MKTLFTITTFIMLGLLSACSADSIMAPKPRGISGPPADAPESYLAGWNDGCETGMSTMGTSYYKSFYGYSLDPDMMEDSEYYRAWRDAYTYCRHFTFKSVWDGIDKMNHPALDKKICVFCF